MPKKGQNSKLQSYVTYKLLAGTMHRPEKGEQRVLADVIIMMSRIQMLFTAVSAV